MAQANSIDWNNLTPEQAGLLEEIASQAAQNMLHAVDGCDQRIRKDRDGSWGREAAAEKAMWQRLIKHCHRLRAACVRVRVGSYGRRAA